MRVMDSKSKLSLQDYKDRIDQEYFMQDSDLKKWFATSFDVLTRLLDCNEVPAAQHDDKRSEREQMEEVRRFRLIWSTLTWILLSVWSPMAMSLAAASQGSKPNAFVEESSSKYWAEYLDVTSDTVKEVCVDKAGEISIIDTTIVGATSAIVAQQWYMFLLDADCPFATRKAVLNELVQYIPKGNEVANQMTSLQSCKCGYKIRDIQSSTSLRGALQYLGPYKLKARIIEHASMLLPQLDRKSGSPHPFEVYANEMSERIVSYHNVVELPLMDFILHDKPPTELELLRLTLTHQWARQPEDFIAYINRELNPGLQIASFRGVVRVIKDTKSFSTSKKEEMQTRSSHRQRQFTKSKATHTPFSEGQNKHVKWGAVKSYNSDKNSTDNNAGYMKEKSYKKKEDKVHRVATIASTSITATKRVFAVVCVNGLYVKALLDSGSEVSIISHRLALAIGASVYEQRSKVCFGDQVVETSNAVTFQFSKEKGGESHESVVVVLDGSRKAMFPTEAELILGMGELLKFGCSFVKDMSQCSIEDITLSDLDMANNYNYTRV